MNSTWDKVFPRSEKVGHNKVAFTTTFGIELVADLYVPNVADTDKLPAIAVSGPFGAVKEQSSGLYAQQLAEQGFLTIAFDPSFTGESGGVARRVAAPDINTEDFLAAVDFLSNHPDVDPERIGILGVRGWGGIALNAAATDPRIKATLASTMYDMTRVGGNGYYDEQDSAEARNENRRALAQQRTADYGAGTHAKAGGVIDPLPEGMPQFVQDYHAYYKTDRGFHERSGNSTDGWDTVGTMAYANARFMHYIDEIDNAVMILHGAQAHSRYFGEAAFDKLQNGINPSNKELIIVEDASHCDLYDGGDNGAIPWENITEFYLRNLV